ncbi:MAG TPA: hypothetical protein V6D17_02145 [Candidatus Obscuribacterales bacterium]
MSPASAIPPGKTVSPTGGNTLADRVANSFGLALVIVESEFSEKNALGLEAMRIWARENFHRDPSFLHPVSLAVPVEIHHSVFDSLLYNLVAGPLYFSQGRTMEFLRWRIAEFQKTRAYESFRSDYYDLVGLDTESALLLARYQSDRAKVAVNVILCAAFWIFVAGAGICTVIFSKPGTRSTKGQRLLSYGWLLTALLYTIIAWTQNLVPVMVSGLLCLAVGLYLRRPVLIGYGEDSGLSFRLVSLGSRVVAVCSWISLTLLAIRLLTWIKTGTLVNPDPITLLISSWTGDFLHDPLHAKRDIGKLIGLAWVLFSAWVLQYMSVDRKAYREVEAELSTLDGSYGRPGARKRGETETVGSRSR